MSWSPGAPHAGSKPFYLEGTFELLPGAPWDSCKVEMLHIDAWGLGLPENVSLTLSLQMILGTQDSKHPDYSASWAAPPSGCPLCTDRETEGLALTALFMFFILSPFTYSSWENLLEVKRYPVNKRIRTRTKSAVFLFGILSKRSRDLLQLGELGAEPGLNPVLQAL